MSNGGSSSSSGQERLKVCGRRRSTTRAPADTVLPTTYRPASQLHPRQHLTRKLLSAPSPCLQHLSAHASRIGGELNSSSTPSSSSTSSGAATPGLPPQPPAPAPDSIAGSSEDVAGPFTASGLPFSSEPYHPLEFYPSSHIDMNWGAAGLGGSANGAASTDAGETWLGAPAGDRARCFVILFGVGRAETEGIYSLRAVAKDDGLPVDTIVAFENEDDALRWVVAGWVGRVGAARRRRLRCGVADCWR